MVEQRYPDGSSAPGDLGQEPQHVTVAFPGYHRSWATWLAHRLETHGHRPALQRWDPSREQPLEEALEDLLLARGRVLLVLSDWFFQLGPRPEGEWNTVLRGFVRDNSERFAAVNLTNRPLLPATAVLEPADLWGVSEEEAERRLFSRLGLPRRSEPLSLPGGPGSRFPNDPVAVWGEVPRRNRQFTGRDELLNEIQQRLTDSRPGAAACTLVGMSGIGKTQIAAEYAHRFSPDYDVVWWINSDQRNTLRERFGELAVELDRTESFELGERIRAAREALHRGRPYGRWLLVFDGWDETEEASQYLPQGGTGHVLITSRNRSWGEVTDVIDVTGFRRAESTGYLMRRAPHVGAAQAEQIAGEFNDVPLQMAQAAAWLGESKMDPGEYLRMVRRSESGGTARPSVIPDYSDSSITSWSILINRLRSSEPHTIELLKLCCAFAPGRIPLGLVRGLNPADLPENLKWIATDRPAWARALDSLVNFSVLTRQSRGSARSEGGPERESVHMHRTVYNIVGELTVSTDRPVYQEVVRKVLAMANPGAPEDSRNWTAYTELIPHLGPSGAFTSEARDTQALVLNCVRYCQSGGEYRAGADLAETVREEWSQFLEPDATPMLHLTTIQGNILRAAGRFQEAYDLDSSRLERLRGVPDTDEEKLMTATASFAADQRFLGQYAEALQMQREVVSTAERLLGPDDWTTLLAHHNLAVGLRLLGRYAEAYEVDLETLRQRETLLRHRHPDTLSSVNSCSRDLRLMGRYQDALARQELCVRRHVQVMGAQHPKTLWARHNLMLCERRAGTSKQDTGTVLESLLEQQQQTYGRSHYSTFALITDYGNFLRVRGELDRAADLLNEAEEGYRRLLGQAHPVSTGMQSNIGLVLQAEGDRGGALNMFEQALAGLRTTLGDNHPATLGCALNAACGRNFIGRLDDAVELSRETLRRARHVLGDDHPLTLSCQVALAADLRAVRERKEAGKQEEDALQRLTRSLGAQHPHTLSARQRVRPYWDFEPYLG
ncbi:tetratricopeptide repeat protein [Streptomyces sp. HNM0575]|uniref:FxSxx-COOH system tetratricopeptide repeat protein n=1 Tax=Streptomyces sp. HNM0575 TaxID=2716338 RepID=UPI00145D8012|nr:FxSxx-COOH system tetratricopeptide repeat protein [Streptomyces sp. HNM0575]NLU71966.1 tetratricopeptide repeat protein [Streptomyces sp. HNM0575]